VINRTKLTKSSNNRQRKHRQNYDDSNFRLPHKLHRSHTHTHTHTHTHNMITATFEVILAVTVIVIVIVTVCWNVTQLLHCHGWLWQYVSLNYGNFLPDYTASWISTSLHLHLMTYLTRFYTHTTHKKTLWHDFWGVAAWNLMTFILERQFDMTRTAWTGGKLTIAKIQQREE
jgi:hypothetical protein